MFQSFKFVLPKQEVCACHVQYNFVKHNNKSNIIAKCDILGCKVYIRIV